MRDRDSTLFIITAGEKSIIGELRWNFGMSVISLSEWTARTEFIHTGKEANNIDNEPLVGWIVHVFRNRERKREKIAGMRQCDAEKIGINRGNEMEN
jgi:hypothetical protein